jgi:hypothetical protein
MAILFTLNESHGLFISSWLGTISDADLIPAYERLFATEGWKPGFNEIADVREADMAGVTSKGMRQLAMMVESYLRGRCEGFKTAVVAHEDLPFGMARIYAALSDQSPESVRVFRDLKAALEWIGVDESVMG